MKLILAWTEGKTEVLVANWSVNQMAADSRLQVQSWIFFFQNILYSVKLKVLGLKANWYTGSAFYQIPLSYSSYLNLLENIFASSLVSLEQLVHMNSI